MIIILFSDIHWHGLHQRPHHIASALAKQWKVLWIEPTTLGEKSHSRPFLARPNIYVVSLPTIPYNARAPFIKSAARLLSYVTPLRWMVSLIQFILLRKALSILGWRGESIGFVIYNFQFTRLVTRLRSSFMLFDYMDNVFGFTRLPKHMENEWVRTIRMADLITVTSVVLGKQIEQRGVTKIHHIGNGVDYQLFSEVKDATRPADLPEGKPIVGYIGAVYPWLDYELLRYVCSIVKEVHFVFIGTIHPGVSAHVQELSRLENVRFLGFRRYETIPQYLHFFDVGIIPFQKNELTAAVNPVKLYEYSAAGIPTVATDFSEDVSKLRDKIFVSDSKEDFIISLQSAIKKSKDPSFAARLQTFAREHDWETKTSLILQFIHQHLAAQHAS